MSTTNIPSACRIATIDQNDAMILSHDANLCRMAFSELTAIDKRAKRAALAVVCTENLNADIVVMKPAKDRA